jgi:hypothetical protein
MKARLVATVLLMVPFVYYMALAFGWLAGAPR